MTNHLIRALLISNSTNYGQGYLDHVEAAILAFLGGIKRIIFVPYALKDWGAYTAKARARFAAMGIELLSVHEDAGSIALPFASREGDSETTAIFIGGGNTFRLLKRLREQNLMYIVEECARRGAKYIGANAGTVVACPTIMTTNDMPIVQLNTFDALNIVPFQINPHYLDPEPNSQHMGETRETRIKEFHEENKTPVVGLREGSWIHVEGGYSNLGGPKLARLFLQGKEPIDISDGFTIEAAIQTL